MTNSKYRYLPSKLFRERDGVKKKIKPLYLKIPTYEMLSNLQVLKDRTSLHPYITLITPLFFVLISQSMEIIYPAMVPRYTLLVVSTTYLPPTYVYGGNAWNCGPNRRKYPSRRWKTKKKTNSVLSTVQVGTYSYRYIAISYICMCTITYINVASRHVVMFYCKIFQFKNYIHFSTVVMQYKYKLTGKSTSR